MIALSPAQEKIHRQAMSIASDYLQKEFDLIEVLDQVERTKLFKRLDCSSLFKYATDFLGLSESIAYSLISIMRKSRELPEIKTIPVSKASRIVSVIDAKNAAEWIRFAGSHSKREIENEIAKRFPERARPERVKAISAELSEITLTVSKEFLAKLERALDLEAQRHSKAGSRVQALDAALDNYLFHRDPVQKAARAQARNSKATDTDHLDRKTQDAAAPLAGPEKLRPGRVPLTAAQKHAVNERDGGRCAYVDHRGKRCSSSRWIAVHHIRTVEMGGSNDPENLTSLCAHHHDLVHQMTLPMRYG